MTFLALALALAVTMPQPFGDLMARDHVLIAGAPGTGKSPFAAALVEGGRDARPFGISRAARRVVYFDSGSAWREWGERVAAEDLADDPRLLAGVTLRIVVEPGDGDQLLRDFATTEAACRAAAPHGGLVLVIDEIGDLNRAGGEVLLRGLHRNGHKSGIASIMASPCWTDFPARCRSTASRVFSFFQRSDDDIRTLNAELGRQVAGFGDRSAAWRYPAPPVSWRSPTLHDF